MTIIDYIPSSIILYHNLITIIHCIPIFIILYDLITIFHYITIYTQL